MITYIEAEKTPEKIQHPCMTKTLIKVGMKGNFINQIKGINKKTIANIVVNDEIFSL